MIFTLTKNPIEYYSNIRNHMTNCYLAEDVYQIIIGIDCDYVDSNSYSYDDLQKFILQKNIVTLLLLDYLEFLLMKQYITLKILMKLKMNNTNFQHFYLQMLKHICTTIKTVKYILSMGIKINI